VIVSGGCDLVEHREVWNLRAIHPRPGSARWVCGSVGPISATVDPLRRTPGGV